MTTKTKTTKTSELRKPQVRILKALAKHGDLTRAEIAKKAPCDLAWLCSWVGVLDPKKRKAEEFPSLISLGYVARSSQDEGPDKHSITPSGKKALAATK